MSRFGRYSIIKPKSLDLELIPKSRIPASIQRPEYFQSGVPQDLIMDIPIYKNGSLDRIKKVNALTRDTLEWISDYVKPGVTTAYLNQLVHDRIITKKAYPSPLFYHNYPASICTSVNNVICHGIFCDLIIGLPDNRLLEDGDIINVDISVFQNGFHGDCSKTIQVGNVDDLGKDLINKTRESLRIAISKCGPNVPFCTIGNSIQEYVDSTSNYSISKEFCGHGIGTSFHQAPLVEHFENDYDLLMRPGMVFTIEPILTQGSSDFIKAPDEWTILTSDNGRAAQFEHTILITDNGALILTE